MIKKIFFVSLIIGMVALGGYCESGSFSIYQLTLINPVSLPPAVDNVYGLRNSVIYGSNRNVAGFDVGLFGECQDNMTGAQVNLIGSSNGTTGGLQIGGIAGIAGTLKGIQVSGLYNYSGTVVPLSIQASICNVAGESQGGQFGVLNVSHQIGGQFGIYNVTDKSGGIQIGLINITNDELKGYQIGLFNISKDRFMPILNLVPYKSPLD